MFDGEAADDSHRRNDNLPQSRYQPPAFLKITEKAKKSRRNDGTLKYHYRVTSRALQGELEYTEARIENKQEYALRSRQPALEQRRQCHYSHYRKHERDFNKQ